MFGVLQRFLRYGAYKQTGKCRRNPYTLVTALGLDKNCFTGLSAIPNRLHYTCYSSAYCITDLSLVDFATADRMARRLIDLKTFFPLV